MIDTQPDLDQLVERLSDEPVLAVDCEMDSMYAYSTSLCVVQLGWPEGEALLDGLADLDRSGLAALFARDDVIKVFHGGENDVGLMSDRWGMAFARIFDTMAASQVLGHDRVGLAAVLETHFDVKLSKKYQKADWRIRPLPEDQAEYARLDVRYLLPLRERLQAGLEELDRVEEAESEFARISRACIEEKPFDPDCWVRIKGAREVRPDQRAVVKALYVARDALARERDCAPYRIFHDSTLLELAKRRPRNARDVARVRGVSRSLRDEELAALADAVSLAEDVEPIRLPKVPPKRRGWNAYESGMTPEQEATLKALRAWRVKRAEARGVEVARVATTAMLAAIARAQPGDAEALADVEGMEPWRMREYADDILGVVASVTA